MIQFQKNQNQKSIVRLVAQNFFYRVYIEKEKENNSMSISVNIENKVKELADITRKF